MMSLPDANAPLILADGTKIDPATGNAIRDKKYGLPLVEIPNAFEAQEIVAKTRRSIKDLPVAPQAMNGISLVCFYTMWGLNNQDIAIQLGVSLEQVKTIKALAEYKQIQADLMKTVLEAETQEVRGIFQQRAREAAGKIVETMNEEGVLGFKAAQDILDRSGNRPADVVEHRHRLDNSLQIEIIKRADDKELPVIDADFTRVN